MGNIPGKAKTPWVDEYRNPAMSSGPGKDGGSVANPMGNCARCGQLTHHENLFNHHMTKHLGASFAALGPSRGMSSGTHFQHQMNASAFGVR